MSFIFVSWGGNFCLNLDTLCFPMFCILSFQPKSANLLFRPSSRDSPGRTFFLFTATSNSMTSCIWELVCRQTTWPYYRKRLCSYMSLILATILTLSQRTSHETFWISLCLHIILIIKRSTLRSLNSSAAVSFQVLLQYKELVWLNIDIHAFFISNAFFSTQPQCCLTFSWIELQMLLRYCLIRKSIITRKHIYIYYICVDD